MDRTTRPTAGAGTVEHSSATSVDGPFVLDGGGLPPRAFLMALRRRPAISQAVTPGAPRALGPEMATDNTDSYPPISVLPTLPERGYVLPPACLLCYIWLTLATHERALVGKMVCARENRGTGSPLCRCAKTAGLLACTRARRQSLSHVHWLHLPYDGSRCGTQCRAGPAGPLRDVWPPVHTVTGVQ